MHVFCRFAPAWTALGLALSAACSESAAELSDGGGPPQVDAGFEDPISDAASGSASDVGDLDPSLGGWETLAPMPGPARFYSGAGGLGDRVIVLGGDVAPQTTLAQAYDTKAHTWETLEPLPSPFTAPNVAVVGDRLFVLGGLRTQSTLEYDSQGHWVERTPLPLAGGRGAAAVGVWGTKIVVAGGIVPGLSNNMLATGVRQVEVVAYDTEIDTWQMLAPLGEAVAYGMGAVVSDQFWLFGGSTNDERTASVHSLDLAANIWNTETALDRTLSSGGIGVVGGRIYLLGGVAGNIGAVSTDVLRYAPQDGMLVKLAPLSTPRFGCAAAVVGGHIYLAGGTVVASATDVHSVTTFDVFIP